jgi:hypothetical protein
MIKDARDAIELAIAIGLAGVMGFVTLGLLAYVASMNS